MELIDVIQQVMGRYLSACALTDLVVGTVTKTAPLEVSEQDVRDPIPAAALRLTSAVVEKKIPVLGHSHSIPLGVTDERLVGVACYENGKALPVRGGYILLNRGLEAGDKVLMLRVQSGQSYIILSRVVEVASHANA